jgi:uncharacterized membrane protein
MRVEASCDIAAPPERVWQVIEDPRQVPRVLAGVTRWDVVGDVDRGMGARYRVLMRVGSADVGGEVEIVEHDPPRDMAWHSVTGVDHRGRWRIRPAGANRSRVTIRLSYSAPGGLLGLLSDRVAAPMVRRNLKRSLTQLRDGLEGAGLDAQGINSLAPQDANGELSVGE